MWMIFFSSSFSIFITFLFLLRYSTKLEMRLSEDVSSVRVRCAMYLLLAATHHTYTRITWAKALPRFINIIPFFAWCAEFASLFFAAIAVAATANNEYGRRRNWRGHEWYCVWLAREARGARAIQACTAHINICRHKNVISFGINTLI